MQPELDSQHVIAVVSRAFDRHRMALDALAPSLLLVANLARALATTLRSGGTIFWVGNGGSAADAQHLSAELVGRYVKPRPGLRSVALSADTSALTAIGNDFGFDQVFARQLEALGRPGDALVVISTSGNSVNVLEALGLARRQGLLTCGLLGRDGGAAASLCEYAIVVPTEETARIQEMHGLIGHALCEYLDGCLDVQ